MPQTETDHLRDGALNVLPSDYWSDKYPKFNLEPINNEPGIPQAVVKLRDKIVRSFIQLDNRFKLPVALPFEHQAATMNIFRSEFLRVNRSHLLDANGLIPLAYRAKDSALLKAITKAQPTPNPSLSFEWKLIKPGVTSLEIKIGKSYVIGMALGQTWQSETTWRASIDGNEELEALVVQILNEAQDTIALNFDGFVRGLGELKAGEREIVTSARIDFDQDKGDRASFGVKHTTQEGDQIVIESDFMIKPRQPSA